MLDLIAEAVLFILPLCVDLNRPSDVDDRPEFGGDEAEGGSYEGPG